MKASSASERRSKQEGNFRRLLRDITEHAADVALKGSRASRKNLQRVIEGGDKLREAVTDTVVSVMEKLSTSRLRYVKSVPVPASEDVVLTEQLLREKYNIGWFGGNFRRLLLGKTLKGAPKGLLAINELKEYSTNQQLKDEMGDQAVLPLAYMFSFIEEQRNGEHGHLLTNGYANLVIVEVEEEIEENGEKIVKKTLWAVLAYWGSARRCWGVGAFSVEDPYRWVAGRQVFSRDS